VSQLTVEKIGGTSMSRFSEVLRNVILRDPKRVYGRIYVVSAHAGVTDLLLEHENSATPGVYTAFAKQGAYAEALHTVRVRFFEVNASLKGEELDVEAADRFIGERIALALADVAQRT
jgi:aspartate kinase